MTDQAPELLPDIVERCRRYAVVIEGIIVVPDDWQPGEDHREVKEPRATLLEAADIIERLTRPTPAERPIPQAWRWNVSPNQLNWVYSESPSPVPQFNVEPLYALPPDEPARVTPSTVGGEALDARVVAEGIIDAAFNETNPPAKRPRAKGDRRELMVEILADCIRKRLSSTIASEKECESDQTKENK